MNNKIYKCVHCGRNLGAKVAHRCKGTFRKRELEFRNRVSGQIEPLVNARLAKNKTYVVGLILTKRQMSNATATAHRLVRVTTQTHEEAVGKALAKVWKDELKDHELLMLPIIMEMV